MSIKEENKMSNETNCSNERNCDTCKWSNEPCIQENYADWQPKTPDKSCENCEYQDDIFCDNPIGKCKDMEKVENWTPIKDQTPLETDKEDSDKTNYYATAAYNTVCRYFDVREPYADFKKGVVKDLEKLFVKHSGELEQQVKDLKERLAEAVEKAEIAEIKFNTFLRTSIQLSARIVEAEEIIEYIIPLGLQPGFLYRSDSTRHTVVARAEKWLAESKEVEK